MWLECRKLAADLFETHAIRSFVGAGIVGKLDGARRHHAGDDLCQVPDAIVVGGLADVKRFIEYLIGRRLKRSNECPRDILNMHDGPPRRAVRFQADLPGRERPSHKIIQNNIEAQPRRKPVGRCGPQINGTKATARQARDVVLGHDFRLPVSRHWIERAGLINHFLAGLAVIAAG